LTEGVVQRAQTVPLAERFSISDAGGRGAVPGLYIRCGGARPGPKGTAVAGPVTYFCQARVRGALRHVRLGPSVMGLDRARELARDVIRKAAGGVEVAEERAAERVKGLTLLQYAAGDYRRHLSGLRSGEARLRELRKLGALRVRGGRTLGSIPLASVTAEDVEDVLAERKLQKKAAGTLFRDWRTLSACLRRAWKDGAVASLPFKGTPAAIDGMKPAARMRWVGQNRPEELRAFERALAQEQDEPIAIAIRLYMLTGMRRRELLGLSQDEVSWELGIATLPPSRHKAGWKSGKPRIVQFNAEAQRLLKSLKVRDLLTGEFFPGAREGFSWEERLRAGWVRVRDRAKLRDLQLRDLRHHFAVRVRQGGAPLETVRDLLGHSTVAMSERYAHVAATELSDAVAKVRL